MCQKELQNKITTSRRKSRDKELHAGKKTFGKEKEKSIKQKTTQDKEINKTENNSR